MPAVLLECCKSQPIHNDATELWEPMPETSTKMQQSCEQKIREGSGALSHLLVLCHSSCSYYHVGGSSLLSRRSPCHTLTMSSSTLCRFKVARQSLTLAPMQQSLLDNLTASGPFWAAKRDNQIRDRTLRDFLCLDHCNLRSSWDALLEDIGKL